MLEHCVAISVEGHGHAATLHQGADQQEVAASVLMLTEPVAHHLAGSIVHRDQQRERRGQVPQPRVIAPVHLDQHSLPWHPLPTDSMFGWSASPRTAQSSGQQDPSQGGPAHVDALPFPQQLRQMGMVDASVPGAGQMRHLGDQRLWRGVDGSATAVAVGQSRRPAFTVGHQDAAGVAVSYSHQLGCLVQGHVLFCQAVENLKSALFFWGQCHILHIAGQLVGIFSLDVDTRAVHFLSVLYSGSCRQHSRPGRRQASVGQAVGPVSSVAADLGRCRLRGPIGGLGLGHRWLVAGVVRRNPDSHRFEVLPRRWVVELTLGWLSQCRRLSKDYEERTESSEARVHIAIIHLMLKRLQPA